MESVSTEDDSEERTAEKEKQKKTKECRMGLEDPLPSMKIIWTLEGKDKTLG